MLVGQAPGAKEIIIDKPFAWTAGKNLFGWFDSIGINEALIRHKVYMTAVCRCFPGKLKRGGDRVPSADEIKNCSHWLKAEIQIVKPELVILVGKLAISQVLPVKKLTDVVGTVVTTQIFDHPCDVIPLPHPSGASTWHRSEPGKSLLFQALDLVKQHPAWKTTFHVK
jgi:uracil-DNA glycosylase